MNGMSGATTADETMPWYLKAIIGIAILVILLIIGFDLLAFANTL